MTTVASKGRTTAYHPDLSMSMSMPFICLNAIACTHPRDGAVIIYCAIWSTGAGDTRSRALAQHSHSNGYLDGSKLASTRLCDSHNLSLLLCSPWYIHTTVVMMQQLVSL